MYQAISTMEVYQFVSMDRVLFTLANDIISYNFGAENLKKKIKK